MCVCAYMTHTYCTHTYINTDTLHMHEVCSSLLCLYQSILQPEGYFHIGVKKCGVNCLNSYI